MVTGHRRADSRISRRSLIGATAATSVAWSAPGFLQRAAAANLQQGATFRMMYPNLTTLDPHFVTNGMWFVTEGLLEGLTKLTDGGRKAVGAAAETWEVSEDGLTYTFTLRDAKWSNGEPLTAKDFEWSYQRLLTPTSASTGVTLGANSFQPSLGISGAKEYYAGASEDWETVGIKAVDDKTVEFTLDYPNTEFPQLLTHPSMVPLNKAMVDAGGDWVSEGKWAGNGPFVPTAWTVNTDIQLAPNEEYWDRAAVTLGGINVALAGEGPVAYEADELDMVSLVVADLVRYQADPDLAEQVKTAPQGTVGYMALLRSKNPALEDVNVRKALSLAINREMIGQVMPNTRMAGQLVPDTLEGFDAAMNTPYDLEQARQLLADAGYPNGEGFPELRFLYGGENIIAEALGQQLSEDLGIKVTQDSVEAGVYVERRWAVQEDDYIGFYVGTFGSTPTWSTWVASLWNPQFVEEFSLPAAVWAEYQAVQTNTDLTPAEINTQLAALREEHASPEAKAFTKAVEDAWTVPDAEGQREALKAASKARQDAYIFLPIFYQDAYWAQKPNVGGIEYMQGGLHFYYKTITKS